MHRSQLTIFLPSNELKELSTHAYIDFYGPATIYAGLGDKDETFRLLERAYEQHSASMPYLAADPSWYSIRSDPRYAGWDCRNRSKSPLFQKGLASVPITH